VDQLANKEKSKKFLLVGWKRRQDKIAIWLNFG